MVFETIVQGYTHFPKWPDPFRGQMREVRELACQDGWLAKVKFNGRMWGKFAWTAFIPQPTEIIRKGLTGSYKCGFYLDVDVASPLDVIWKDGSASEFLMKLAHWPVTGLFMWWAAETAIDALSTWSSVALLQARCHEPDATVSMFLGSASTGIDGPGSIAQYPELWGNAQYGDKVVGQMTAPPAGARVAAWGEFLTGNRLVDMIMVGYTPVDPVTGFPSDHIDFANPLPNAPVSWSTPTRFILGGATAAVAIYVKFKAGSAGFGVTFGCSAFVSFYGDKIDDAPTPIEEAPLQDTCLPY